MHYVFSSIISFLLTPIHWIIGLLILYFYAKKERIKKISIIAVIIFFFVFSNPWFINTYAKMWQSNPYNINDTNQYSCGIVLGGFASVDADEKGFFNSAADRFIQVLKLYKLGKIKNIIVCGGNGKVNGENFNEGQWVKNELKIMGVPDTVIYVEDMSRNTFDNASYAKLLIDSKQLPPPYLLISSAHHLPRAKLLFDAEGLKTIAVPCNYIAGVEKQTISEVVPDLENLYKWRLYLKETAAYWMYKIKPSRS